MDIMHKVLGNIAALLLIALAINPANAVDRKIYSPTGICAPYTPTTSMAELIIRPGGITNGGSTAEAVLCSIPVDSETNWTATDGKTALIEITFNAGTVGGSFLCQAQVSSGFDGTPAIFTTTQNLPANSVNNVTISSIHGDAVAATWMAYYPVNLYCRIPPKSTMLRIRVIENGAQETDDSTL